MLHLVADPEAWASLATLAALEVVLGIDNVIFLSIVSSRLPAAQQPAARRIGLALALVLRIVLLLGIAHIVALTAPVFTLLGEAFSWRDLVLLGGGLFLLAKGTAEVHRMMEGDDEAHGAGAASFALVIAQIAVLDVVFSLDSVITAVGMAQHVEIMIAAVVIAIGVMMLAAEPTAAFVNRHPTVKMLALSFLILVGFTLAADGLHFHVPRGYVYAAIAFSVAVEVLNRVVAARRRARRGSSPG